MSATQRLRRLAGMSLDELRCRGRQQGAKWIDQLRLEAPRDPRALLQRRAPALADPAVALDCLRDTFDRNFFAGVNANVVAILRSDCALVDGIVEAADALLAGRFDLLGYRGLTFGDPVDWSLDPLRSRRAPLVHWSRLNALDPLSVGDSKVVWELNRHQWMVTLAQASVLTGDEKYARHAMRLLKEWIAENPAGRGINWASSLEVALRLIAWTWVLALLRNTQLLDSVITEVLGSINSHASHVQRYLSNYYSPNTHLTGEALGLFYAGTLFPQFEAAAKWRDLGAAILIAQAERQVTDDGVYFEQSTCYQRYTCDIYLHFLLLAGRSGFELPFRIRERLGRMIEFLAAVSSDEGMMPAIGDADGGWLLPLLRRSADDCAGTLAVAAAVLGRQDWSAGCRPAPEVRWLAGESPTTAILEGPRESRLFAEGGYAILQSGAHQMIVDVGPIGCFGHGHADLLSIQCSCFGERCLVDPGTYGYTAEPAWREYFRGTTAHNTIAIDQASQAMPRGPFGWQDRPAVTIREWRSAPHFDLIDAEHHAYRGVTHRRRVVSMKTLDAFVIVDDLAGEGAHTFELTFQFAPMKVAMVGDTIARATTPGGRTLWMLTFASMPLHQTIITGRLDPIRGWTSADYGQRTAAPSLVCSGRSLPACIVTILYPRREQTDRPPSIEPVVARLRETLNEPCAVLPEF